MNRILLFILLMPLFAISQTPDFVWAKNHGQAFYGGRQYTAVDVDGNIYLAGDFVTPTLTIGSTILTNTSAEFGDIYIIKYDPDGNILWARSYGGTNNESILAITTDKSGHFYITAHFAMSLTLGSSTLFCNGTSNFFAKFDSTGDPLWAKTNEGTIPQWRALGITTDASDNVYISGSYINETFTFGEQSVSNQNASTFAKGQSFVGKFDAAGNCVWLRSSQATATPIIGAEGIAIGVTSDGSVIATGRFGYSSLSFDDVLLNKTGPSEWNADMFVVKYSADGELQWAKNGGSMHSQTTNVSSLMIDHADNVYLTVNFGNTFLLDDVSLNAGAGYAPSVIKLNSDGNVLWATAVPSSNCSSSYYSADVDDDGNVYLAGMTSCSAMDFGNGITMSFAGNSFYALRYNSDGSAAWVKKSGPSNYLTSASIAVKSFNEIYLTGVFDSSTLTLDEITLHRSTSLYDMFLSKLYFVPLATDDFAAGSFSVYPNPFSDKLTVESHNYPCEFSITDMLGKKLQSDVLTSNTTIDASWLSTGFFIIQLKDNYGNTSVKKIICH